MTDDTKVAIPATGKLKKDLNCWEAPQPGAPRVLKRYQAGDPVPGHLRPDQLARLKEQGVI
ncbi:hypothetical protein [Candidatus Macondimonas diazotrophica]|jgi:hypothetical protein|uniref:Uncharacterized protein n=1 Tax=Candidatus Macondimonas diazotrophica TaxID=2305248 RepID=A0A4Z0F7G9_9GAMM|nr:hypothetical protein [Candidatus Macondimonas diazotrophica]NCU01991.1 hypothetical protein [Candidatus Macondimonas diazotrophica]TFZ81353.1 hypothetical protein E4680_12905 [Candidatus Macondimonas diazotrophica]